VTDADTGVWPFIIEFPIICCCAVCSEGADIDMEV